MPEFNKPYTYGTGKFKYVIKMKDGALIIECLAPQGVKVRSEEAFRYHLKDVIFEPYFRYI